MHVTASPVQFAQQLVSRPRRRHGRTEWSSRLRSFLAGAVLVACGKAPVPVASRDTTAVARRPAVGDFVPVLKVATLVGDSVKFGGRGKQEVTFVNLWATFCRPCIEEFPLLDTLNTQFAPRGLRVLAISSDLLDGPVHALIMAKGSLFTIGRDPEAKLSRMFGEGELPQNVLLSADGRILWTGALGQRIPSALTIAIDSALAVQ